MFTKVTEFTDGFIEARYIPGNDCIIMHNGECVYRHFAGYSDLENKIPMNGSERYNIYSCSKISTCVAALQLMEKGMFGLDTPIADIMPEFAEMKVHDGENSLVPAKRQITVEHLFTMTAGFSYDLNSPALLEAKKDPDLSTREAMKALAKEPLWFQPGECWCYSLCHDVLAALVEVASGKKFEDYTAENIFKPLGMNRTTFMLPECEVEGLAAQYRYDGVEKKLVNCGKHICGYKLGNRYASGGAGVISCVEDYIKLLEALRIGDVILKKESIDLMQTDRLSQYNRRDEFWMKEAYGYGLGVRCKSAILPDGAPDFGWGGAAGAFASIDRVSGFTIYYSQHVLGSPVQPQRPKLSALVREAISRVS